MHPKNCSHSHYTHLFGKVVSYSVGFARSSSPFQADTGPRLRSNTDHAEEPRFGEEMSTIKNIIFPTVWFAFSIFPEALPLHWWRSLLMFGTVKDCHGTLDRSVGVALKCRIYKVYRLRRLFFVLVKVWALICI